MNIKHIHLLSEAEADLEDGRSFYENQEQGVGEYFWDSLISDIESLIIYAGVHFKEYSYYRMSSKRFPYSIYYDLNDKAAYVIAVLPERRNPNWVRSKLSKKS
ncbi:MAG: type II toxin-antitoxin system RelE/ParE family toxin [Gammaproteobacteria bacterium]|nr:type II toxin-antitoxin system RelE/ParE family toxin [Gammaproteobacteria bacterium]